MALILGGLVVLVGGGEVLVRGAGGLARSLGMSPLLVGLTVVAFATSAPELAVSLQSALGGNPGLAVGNVVGSNIANVLLILGLSAVIAPLAVHSTVVRRDIPMMGAVSVLAWLVARDLRISHVDGLLLFVAMIAYLVVTVIQARREEAADAAGQPEAADAAGHPEAAEAAEQPEAEEPDAASRPLAVDAVLIAVGVGLLVLGANWLVEGATQVARAWGVSDLVIGLTVVAIGTSLPELATSMIATVRGERDIAVGNIVGSCLFNLGVVLGLSAMIASGGIPVEPSAVDFDIPVMVISALALLPIAFTGLAVARWEGALFVAYYAAYITFLVLTAIEDARLSTFTTAMKWFVIPLTFVTLAVVTVGELRRRPGRRSADGATAQRDSHPVAGP